MAWVVFGFGFVIIGLAVAVALGRGGQMQAEPVVDHARGRIPDGPLDGHFLDRLVVPRRMNGYDTAQVDRYLRQLVAGSADPVRFDVRFRGYDMGIVDALLARIATLRAEAEAAASEQVDTRGQAADDESGEVDQSAHPEG